MHGNPLQYIENFIPILQKNSKITINNVFIPTTTFEISNALLYCQECKDIAIVIITDSSDKAFYSKRDINLKNRDRYIDKNGVPSLNIIRYIETNLLYT